MNRRSINVALSVVVLSLIVIVALFAQVADARPPQEGVVVGRQVEQASTDLVVSSKSLSQAEQAAVLDLWTRDEIANAQPMAMFDFGSPEVDQAAIRGAAETLGEPGFVAAGAAAPDADEVARAAYPEDWAQIDSADEAATFTDVLLEPEGTSQVFTHYLLNRYKVSMKMYPHRWIGRLSFSTAGGTSFCSASAISGNTMLTAAHCVYDTTNNVWYSNWAFSPAYRGVSGGGWTPYGTFPATNCWVLTAWVNLTGSFSINTWTRYDVAVCEMGTNSAGQTLNQAVGWMGREWNYGYDRHFHNAGYPFRDYNNNLISYAGWYAHTCVAESFQQTTDTRGMGCNMGPGISGGPWIRGYALMDVTGWASGVNSGLYIGTQNLYSARFTDSNIVPLCNSAGC